ncbi:hypothetical protein B0J14DRAFT_566662 [Halenospora varia]|nr:hypothetical protein B0J14DRAFT_566662 [Halenospora varia]
MEEDEDFVSTFNNLPRPYIYPTAPFRNSWYFDIIDARQLPSARSGPPCLSKGFLLIVNPEGRNFHAIPLSANVPDADPVALRLIRTFSTRSPTNTDWETVSKIEPHSPFSWSTQNTVLASRVEGIFRRRGVRLELCAILPGTTQEVGVWNVIRRRLNARINRIVSEGHQRVVCLSAHVNGTNERKHEPCALCYQCVRSSSLPLASCEDCYGVSYCSKICRKRDLSTHERNCVKLDAVTYYNKMAYQLGKSKRLAESINLELPVRCDFNHSIRFPIRRLVWTGKDTTENIRILLGPNWSDDPTILETWEWTRLEILLHPLRGSRIHAYSQASGEDIGAPPCSPRLLSDYEMSQCRIILEIQNRLRQMLANQRSDPLGAPSNPWWYKPDYHVKIALLATFGSEREKVLPFYEFAVNTMNLGFYLSQD